MQANFIQFLMNPRKWWIPITLILVISLTGVALIGYETYYKAPPIPDRNLTYFCMKSLTNHEHDQGNEV
jgi:nitric oxide reductase large subunit